MKTFFKKYQQVQLEKEFSMRDKYMANESIDASQILVKVFLLD